MYAVGIGSGAYEAELKEVASTPEHILTSSSFEELQNISSELISISCQGRSVLKLIHPNSLSIGL